MKLHNFLNKCPDLPLESLMHDEKVHFPLLMKREKNSNMNSKVGRVFYKFNVQWNDDKNLYKIKIVSKSWVIFVPMQPYVV